MKLLRVIAPVVILALSAAACASRSEVEALRKEVEALKTTQAALLKRVGNGAAQPTAKALPATLDLTGAQFRGSTTSQVVLVEYSDYECPFCIRHFTQVLPEIDAAYIRTNKIRYTFRDFPIDQLHPESIRAHVAAHCATEQGKFWELHNRLFTKSGTHQPAELLARAKEAGLNPGTFSACVAADKYSTAIRESTALAMSMGAEGTPFFIIGVMDGNNAIKPLTKIPGAFPYANFQQAIDAALAGK